MLSYFRTPWTLAFIALAVPFLVACSPPPETDCGDVDQRCCTRTPQCRYSLRCLAQPGSLSYCRRCGTVGDVCCGSQCDGASVCADGRCIACGHEGERCCASGPTRCIDSTLQCAPVQGVERCVPCGSTDQPCCANRACAGGHVCQSDGSAVGQCRACGGEGEPCCTGDRCDVGRQCRSGQCSSLRRLGAFTPCPRGDECPALLVCDSRYPQGMCTVGCADNSECDEGSYCSESRRCVPRCAADADCARFGALCVFDSPGNASRRVCAPACTSRGEPPASRCSDRLACSFVDGECGVASTGAVETDVGRPCAGDADCLARRCVPPVTTRGEPTGYVNGYCTATTLQPAADDFARRVGDDLPRASCPAGAVATPSATLTPATTANCHRACAMDGDCREGYFCEHFRAADGSGGYRNGACIPIDCAQPSPPRTCPSGTACVPPRMGGTGPSRCVQRG